MNDKQQDQIYSKCDLLKAAALTLVPRYSFASRYRAFCREASSDRLSPLPSLFDYHSRQQNY
jgi:hypothetical protein